MNGILNVYKEKGYTSHDVVAKLRGICHQKKIGHTGTLDPDAEGVLPVCLGTAAKACSLITDKDKEYTAILLLGKETDTQDASGAVQKESEVLYTKDEVQKAAESFIGATSQVPPMYSALKVNGKKLYDLARQGIEVARSPRPIRIYDIKIEWICLPRVKLHVHCSKGTYIRTLCHDIGQQLGCGGCMEELLRTRSGMFSIGQSYKLAQIEALAAQGNLSQILLQADILFPEYPKASVAQPFLAMLQNGNRLPKRAFCSIQECAQPAQENSSGSNGLPKQAVCGMRVYLDGEFFAIYALDQARGDYKPMKIFGRGIKDRP